MAAAASAAREAFTVRDMAYSSDGELSSQRAVRPGYPVVRLSSYTAGGGDSVAPIRRTGAEYEKCGLMVGLVAAL
jgi:hypothetical protein